MKYFAKAGTGCHIINHRMAVFHRETKGDGVSTQKRLGAAMGSHAGIGLRHYYDSKATNPLLVTISAK